MFYRFTIADLSKWSCVYNVTVALFERGWVAYWMRLSGSNRRGLGRCIVSRFLCWKSASRLLWFSLPSLRQVSGSLSEPSHRLRILWIAWHRRVTFTPLHGAHVSARRSRIFAAADCSDWPSILSAKRPVNCRPFDKECPATERRIAFALHS